MHGLTFIRESDKPSHKKYGRYKVWSCGFCGELFEALNHQVKNRCKRGGNSHCGCQTEQRQRVGNLGRAPINKLDDLTAVVNKVWGASRKLGRTISKEDVRNLILQPCHYCGAAPAHYRPIGSNAWSRISTVPTNGIDRKYSDIGYTPANCVPCCTTCNMLKSDMRYDLFIQLCKDIARRFK